MKIKATYFGAAAAMMLAGAPMAPAALISLEWNSGFNNAGVIPDDNASGWQDTRTVSTSHSSIVGLAVTLNITGGFNGDLYGYLSHDSGFAVLLNRVGKTSGNPFGYDDAGFIITLSDKEGVLTDIHSYGGNGGASLSGMFQSDGRETDPADVLDTDPRSARLTSFNGLNPNGNWTLYFADLSGGEESTVISWGLEIQAVPEPANLALCIFAAMASGVGAVVWLKRSNRLRRRD